MGKKKSVLGPDFARRPSFLDPPPKGLPYRGIRALGTVALALGIAVALIRILLRWAS